MTTLPNAKHERFAQALADGKTQVEAHGIAGYRPSRSTASGLARDPNISDRVREILIEREKISTRAVAKAVETTAYDIIAAMGEAEVAMKLALSINQPAAAVAAVTLRAKLHGLLIDRKEIRTGPLESSTDDELDRIIRGAAAEAQVSFGVAGEGSETQH